MFVFFSPLQTAFQKIYRDIGVLCRKRALIAHPMCDTVCCSVEEFRFVEITHCVWLEKFCNSRGGVAAVSLVSSYRRRLVLPSSLDMCNGTCNTMWWDIVTVIVRPVVAFGADDTREDGIADADADVGVDVSFDDGESNVAGSSGVAPPESEISPCSDSLCRSPRSAGMPMLKSRAAV